MHVFLLETAQVWAASEMSVLLGGTGALVGEYALAWCIEGLVNTDH